MLYKPEIALKDVEKNRGFLTEFLEWTQGQKRRLPTVHVFLYDALVLYILGKRFQKFEFLDETVRSNDEGVRLYPENEELKKRRKTTLVEAYREMFKGLGMVKERQRK